MKKILIIILLSPLMSLCQDTVYTHVDKFICHPKDTVWGISYILSKDPSTSLIIDLFNYKNTLLFHYKYQVIQDTSGIRSFFQFRSPSDTGIYTMRIYTNNSDFEYKTLVVKGSDTRVVVQRLKSDCSYTGDRLFDLVKDTGGYYIVPKYPGKLSVSVTDSGQFLSFSNREIRPNPNKFVDTSFLYIRTHIFSNVEKGDLHFIINKDSFNTPLNTIPFDKKKLLCFTNLSFFDSAMLFYQVNPFLSSDTLSLGLFPDYISKCDTLDFSWDTITMKDEFYYDTIKILAPVYKTANWQYRHIHLHNLYIKGKLKFMGYNPPNGSFDFEEDPPKDWESTVVGYLRDRIPYPHWSGPLEYYYDGEWQPVDAIERIPLNRIRYIEIIEGNPCEWDKMQDCAYCTIWTKVGNDALSLESKFKHLKMPGYKPVIEWKKDDRVTHLWNPVVRSEKYYLKVKPPFRIEVSGKCGNRVINYQMYIDK